ncbi:mCG1041428 [Mus musculus]|nr:mCG1041428 [Mus musculus]
MMSSNIKEVAHLPIFKRCQLTLLQESNVTMSQYKLTLLRSKLKWYIHLPSKEG